MKVNKSKHVQINLFLHLVFNSFFLNVPILYPLKTSFSRDTKWKHGEIEMELNSIDFFRIKEIVLNKVLKETKKLLSKITFKGKYLGQTSFQCKS